MKRKVHKGAIYDKERTKARLIGAVGKILVKDGFQSIRINKVESVAKVSKKMIYEYFGGLQGLIKAYLNQVDFWKIEEQKLDADGQPFLPLIDEQFMATLLKNDFEYLYDSPEMQKIILWGISEKNKTLRELSDERELMGERILEQTDAAFAGTAVDFRATIAILVASVYHTVLHAKVNGSTVCGIDLSTAEGKNRMIKAMERILSLTYKYADVAL